MSATAVQIAVIGAGRIGRIHAANAARSAAVVLRGVFDVDLAAAQACVEELGVGQVYGSVDAVFADSSLDGVLICSSTDTHAALIERCAQVGLHVFCEKPLAIDIAEVDRAIEGSARGGSRLMVGFNRRFDPTFARLEAEVRAGAVGALHVLRITSRDPSPPPPSYARASGGLFVDMTIHDFDMARFVTGSEVRTVYATGGCLVDPALEAEGDIDTCIVTLELESGALVAIDNSRRAVYGYDQRVEAFGDAGMVAADNPRPTATISASADGFAQARLQDFFLERYRDAYRLELEAFARCVAEDLPPPVSGEDGRRALLIALAARRSLAEGRPVRMSEV